MTPDGLVSTGGPFSTAFVDWQEPNVQGYLYMRLAAPDSA